MLFLSLGRGAGGRIRPAGFVSAMLMIALSFPAGFVCIQLGRDGWEYLIAARRHSELMEEISASSRIPRESYSPQTAGGLEFQRQGYWGGLSSHFDHPNRWLAFKKINVLVYGPEELDDTHDALIREIRANFDPLLKAAVESVVEYRGETSLEFMNHVTEAAIVLGEECDGFDGKSWTLFFEWGTGSIGYHCEFRGMDLLETWGGG